MNSFALPEVVELVRFSASERGSARSNNRTIPVARNARMNTASRFNDASKGFESLVSSCHA